MTICDVWDISVISWRVRMPTVYAKWLILTQSFWVWKRPNCRWYKMLILLHSIWIIGVNYIVKEFTLGSICGYLLMGFPEFGHINVWNWVLMLMKFKLKDKADNWIQSQVKGSVEVEPDHPNLKAFFLRLTLAIRFSSITKNPLKLKTLKQSYPNLIIENRKLEDFS